MQALPFQRLGPAANFPTITAMLGEWTYQSESANDLQRLHDFAAETAVRPEDLCSASESLSDVARDLHRRAQTAALKVESGWLGDWARATAYGYWAHRIAAADYSERPRENAFALHEAGFTLGSCAALGWLDFARALTVQMCGLFDSAFYYDRDERFHRRTQTFVLRLLANWNGSTHEWPSYAYDVPAYDYIVHHWQDADARPLAEALLAACDRHMHQTGEDTVTNSTDICQPQYVYLPFEILTVLRLRQLALTTPQIDHTLMLTPLGQLPEPQPLADDELLSSVVARARAALGTHRMP